VPVGTDEGIGSTMTPPSTETATRPPQDSTSMVNNMSGAADAISKAESDMLQWDMSTAESRDAWYEGRKEARARRKAEAEAAERGETLPPVANPSPAMLLNLSGLAARHARQQRQVASILTSSVNSAADIFTSSGDVAANIVARSVNAVADMHWCINNLDKIRADAGDSRHSDWSDFWEADYRKTKL
jgi:hypothetical protein